MLSGYSILFDRCIHPLRYMIYLSNLTEDTLERKVIGYILVFGCICLMVGLSILVRDMLAQHLQVAQREPSLPEPEKLFSARVLDSVDPGYLNADLEWKDCVREKIVEDRFNDQTGFLGRDKSREELMEELVASEGADGIELKPDLKLVLFGLLMIFAMLIGIHIIATFVVTPSWRSIEIVRPVPVLSITFGIITLLLFLAMSMLAILGVVYGPWGYLLSILGNGLVLLIVSRHMRTSGANLFSDIGLVRVNYVRAVKVGIVGFLAFIPLLVIIGTQGTLMAYFLGLVPEAHPFVDQFRETSSVELQLIIAVLVLLSAPFFEEIFFRGIFLQSLQQRLSPTLACVLCGLVFGLVHGSFLNIFVIFFLGVYLSFLMQKTGSVITPIVVHFLFNTLSLTQVLLLK